MTSNTRYTLSHHVSTHSGVAGSRSLARRHAVAAAVVLCTGLTHLGEAQALALGRIMVQSALGEPLKAEIDVPDINTDEAASLRVGLASGDAFRAAGMDFNAALSSLQITLQRRANGSAYLRLASTRPVNEPFVDLIVEANWASGRIVRDYTLLLDPPNLRTAVPVAPLPAAVMTQPEPQVRPPAVRPSDPAIRAQPAPNPTAPTATATPAERPRPVAPETRPAAALPPSSKPPGDPDKVVVRAGDTAGRIAETNRPPRVSLDQMLVAMLRANPNAFIAGNVNRIKAGAVLDLPSAADAGSVSPEEARQVIVAQSRDFNEFRRRLASTIPATSVAAADRQASGRIQTEVQDQKPLAPAQDKLTLSKGITPAQSASADKIAQDRQAQEASSRVAELSRNIEDLAKVGTSSATVAANTAGTVATETAVPAPALTVPTPPPTPSTATAATSPTETSPTAGLSSPSETTASKPPAPPVAKPAPLPVTAPLSDTPSLIDDLRDNPLVMPAAGGLLALLAGFAFYRIRQRKRDHGVDSSFLESRLQPDSFFGASGGQRIDTADASVSGSSMVYSPSQLDAAGDVDPVAEADVYLAYGRDLQAEEILKEAMRNTPQRVAIHSKLLEIYAKRRDAKAFEVVATEAFDLTQGQGAEWEQACTLGRELEPANPLYEPGGRPPAKAGMAGAFMAGGALHTVQINTSRLPQSSGTADSPMSLDLDLDFSMDEPSAHANPAFSTAAAISGMGDLERTDALTQANPTLNASPASIPFDLDFPSEPAPIEIPALAEQNADLSLLDPNNLTFDSNDVLPDFELEAHQPFEQSNQDQNRPQPVQQSTQANPFDTDAELLSFDLNDIKPNMGSSEVQTADEHEQVAEENPLDTKLALAEEFRSIGYMEGARSLAEEVLAEATGTLKTKASRFLADLN